MRLYNTLSRKVEDFIPNDETIKIYTCGPTVYEKSHIGHWYTYVRNDTLVRLLEFKYKKVTWVINITDVGHLTSDADTGEDKLEKSAKKNKKTAWEIADFYIEDFRSGLKNLNIKHPTVMPRATDHIPDQIDLIQKLEKLGYTYKIDDGVYFDTSKFINYRDFAQLDLDEQQAGSRIEFNVNKRNASDFALWKFSNSEQKRDMEWESPWGTGFPGWHIECSAMSLKYLGDNFDIHSGGIDHIPIHHTNEIAQSMAITGKMPANYWFHSNHVMIDGQKISKSLGNGYSLDDLKNLGYEYEDLRIHILESNYRKQANFKLDSLNATKKRLKSWQKISALIWQINSNPVTNLLEKFKENIIESLEDDLNTPKCLSEIEKAFNFISQNTDKISKEELIDLLQFIDNLLGLHLSEITNISNDIMKTINKREIFKKNKQWIKADKLRTELMNKGIGLEDVPNSTFWYYL